MTHPRPFLLDLHAYVSRDTLKRRVETRTLRVLEKTVARRLREGGFPDTALPFEGDGTSGYRPTAEALRLIGTWPEEERARLFERLTGEPDDGICPAPSARRVAQALSESLLNTSPKKTARRAAWLYDRQKGADIYRGRDEAGKYIDRALAARPYRTAGPEGPDAVDEVFDALHRISPWMAPITADLYRQIRAAVARGEPPRFAPILIAGRAGIGKSHLGRELGRLMRLPLVRIDAGQGTAGFRIAGTERGWGSAGPGLPVRAAIENSVLNPLVQIDDLDRAIGGVRSQAGMPSSLGDALLAFLDHGSAADYNDPFLQTRLDVSHFLWIATCNDVARLDPALLSRFKLHDAPEPAPEHIARLVRHRLSDRDPEIADLVAEHAAAYWARTHAPTLRGVERMIERALTVLHAPRLH